MLGIAANPLSGARRAFDNWVDRFEVTRICSQTNFDLRAGPEFSDRAITEMIFHVAITGHQLGDVVLTKLGKDDAERFLQKVGEHVEPPAMRHAEHDLVDAV